MGNVVYLNSLALDETKSNDYHQSGIKSIDNVVKLEFKSPPKRNSEYTSRGKLKPSAADSVKTIEEINKIKQYFLDRKEYRNYCLFIIGITTGYRCSDLLTLRLRHFLNNDYTWKEEISLLEKKTKKKRNMPITRTMKKALTLSIKEFKKYDLNTFIFKSVRYEKENKPIGNSMVRKLFGKMAKDLNLPYHCSAHFMRKTFAYWFLQIHKNDMTALATLQEILNHSSEEMTLKYCG